jgi:chromosome segregation ATPase
MRCSEVRAPVLLLCTAFLLAPVGPAAAEESRAAQEPEQVIARLQLQLQRLSAERARLQNEVATQTQAAESAQGELETVRAERDALAAEGARQAAVIERLEAVRERLEGGLEQARGNLEELIGRYREAVDTLRELRIDRDDWQTVAQSHASRLTVCERNNAELRDLGLEALEAYENKGCLDRFGQLEPFTGVARVRIDNLVQDYRRLIEELYLGTHLEGEVADPYPAQ